MSESRYRKYYPRRLPKEKRQIPIAGATAYIGGEVVKDQSNIFYRCWNCGFLCNTKKDQLGDGVGYYVTDAPEKYWNNISSAAFQYPCSNASQQAATIMITTVSTPRLIKLDSVGNPATVIHNNDEIITSGCPACGCRNYK